MINSLNDSNYCFNSTVEFLKDHGLKMTLVISALALLAFGSLGITGLLPGIAGISVNLSLTVIKAINWTFIALGTIFLGVTIYICLKPNKFEIIDANSIDPVEKERIINNIFFQQLNIKKGYKTPEQYLNNSLSAESIILLKFNGTFAGFVITASIDNENSEVAWIAVNPKLHKKRIGTRLMLAAMQKASDLNKDRLVIDLKQYLYSHLPDPKDFFLSLSKTYRISMTESDNSKNLEYHLNKNFDAIAIKLAQP